MANAELSGLSIVGAGAFNPAIIHPLWLAEKELIPDSAAKHAVERSDGAQLVVTPQLAVFEADWLTVQVTPLQAVFATIERGRELELRDLVRGIFEILPETPVSAVGINSDTHFRTGSLDAWHAFGDRFLPKDFWEPIFAGGPWIERGGGKHVGMRVMTVEVNRASADLPGHVRVELAPSTRLTPHGVYIGINGHFQLSQRTEDRTTAADASAVLLDEWDETRRLEESLVDQLLAAV